MEILNKSSFSLETYWGDPPLGQRRETPFLRRQNMGLRNPEKGPAVAVPAGAQGYEGLGILLRRET